MACLQVIRIRRLAYVELMILEVMSGLIHIHFVIRVIKGYQACLGLQVIRKLEGLLVG